MQFSLTTKTASLSVGEFSEFALGPREPGSGSGGLWRAQLGQHWHNELRAQAESEHAAATAAATLTAAAPQFEVTIEGVIRHRGWEISLGGRIDQIIPAAEAAARDVLREIKTVLRPLPADETELRAEYPSYFLQLATYAVLRRLRGEPAARSELVFVEASSGLAQAIALTPFDEALVSHRLDELVQFLDLQLRAAERRHRLRFRSPFETLRPGQETIQADLASALATAPIVLFEAPTGYGKTGCALEFALGQLQAGAFDRIIWLTGKATGQIQVVHTLRRMTAADAAPGEAFAPVAFWQMRNKGEHCINHEFHCVRENCTFIAGATERWPQSGLARFYLDDAQPRDLDTLRLAGRETRICPYEITRTALAFNDVWIGDYNYVFAPDNRGIFFEQPGFAAARTLLIIDEAHNLPARVADAYSHRANDADVRALLAELDHLRAPTPLVLAVEQWARVLAGVSPCEVLDGAVEADIRDALARLADLVAVTPLDYAALGPHHTETLWGFPRLNEFLQDSHLHRLLWCRRVGELEFTCVDASEAIGETLDEFGGVLLMSATLAPFDQFAASCGLTTAERKASPAAAPRQRFTSLRAPAPWRQGAYDVAVDLRVSTTLRDRTANFGTTADTIEALHAAAGNAVAVFFPSYAYAEAVLRVLERGAPLRVALQPKLPDLAAQAAWVEESLGLCDALFLVLGSSFAESIDLLGGRVSHAMVVGPALPEVNAVQKARVDALSSLGRDAAFRRVYQIPGLQKVNQALGRLVRGPGQRAKVLLHCRRFADPSYASLLDPECQLYREIVTTDDLHAWLV